MNDHFRHNVIFVVVAFIAFHADPAIVNAQTRQYEPINFTHALSLRRGSLSPASPEAVYLSTEETCLLAEDEWGWDKDVCLESVEHLIALYNEDIDSIVVEVPNSEGYVTLDDWDKVDLDEQIEDIWTQLKESLEQQSRKIGQTIVADKWHVYPTLDRDKSYMYYSYSALWDGEKTLNAKATLFDRKGYLVFRITPADHNISGEKMTEIVETVLAAYQPKTNESYADFVTGDKVAAVGAVGVLATLLGVKYGKAAASGLFAIVLIFLKKAWFLLFVPFVFLKNLIFRRNE